MKRDQIDVLLQLAYLEGKIKTHGAYEKSVLRKKPAIEASAESRNALQARLETALTAKHSSVEIPMTVGMFLRNVRVEQSIRSQEIFARVGLSQNIYRMLEQDRISPLKISVAAWKKFGQLFNLSSNALVEMVRRTHQLVFFRPAFRTTLARYDSRKNKTMKAATLEKAAQELYTRAVLTLPPEEEKKLNALLDSISG
jgi:transcriptional regulator with XRE-family HTH domain